MNATGVESGMVSVVMPACNAAATIGEQLEALSRQSYLGSWEIIVADNGSQDDTKSLVQSWQERLPQLRLVEAKGRRGANFARNVGTKASRCEFFLFSDADDIVSTNWVAAMTAALTTYDTVGGSLERQTLNDEVALAARPLKKFDGLLNTFNFLPYTPFANAGVRRELWFRLGGCDDRYLDIGSDDVEFFWRAQLAGATLGYVSDAMVHYRLRSEPAAIGRQGYYYGRNHPQLFKTKKTKKRKKFNI